MLYKLCGNVGPASSSLDNNTINVAGVVGRMCEQALVLLLELWKSNQMLREESDRLARLLFRSWCRSLARDAGRSRERLSSMLTAGMLSGVISDVPEMERVIRELEATPTFLWSHADLPWLLAMVNTGSALAITKAHDLTTR